MKERDQFLLVRMIPGYEVDECTASSLIVKVTPELKELILNASSVMKSLGGSCHSASSIAFNCDDALFLSPGEADKLMGYPTDENEEPDFNEETFSKQNVIQLDEGTFKKGEVLSKANDIQMFSMKLYVSEKAIWWNGVYKNSDTRTISVGVDINEILAP